MCFTWGDNINCSHRLTGRELQCLAPPSRITEVDHLQSVSGLKHTKSDCLYHWIPALRHTQEEVTKTLASHWHFFPNFQTVLKLLPKLKSKNESRVPSSQSEWTEDWEQARLDLPCWSYDLNDLILTHTHTHFNIQASRQCFWSVTLA